MTEIKTASDLKKEIAKQKKVSKSLIPTRIKYSDFFGKYDLTYEVKSETNIIMDKTHHKAPYLKMFSANYEINQHQINLSKGVHKKHVKILIPASQKYSKYQFPDFFITQSSLYDSTDFNLSIFDEAGSDIVFIMNKLKSFNIYVTTQPERPGEPTAQTSIHHPMDDYPTNLNIIRLDDIPLNLDYNANSMVLDSRLTITAHSILTTLYLFEVINSHLAYRAHTPLVNIESLLDSELILEKGSDKLTIEHTSGSTIQANKGEYKSISINTSKKGIKSSSSESKISFSSVQSQIDSLRIRQNNEETAISFKNSVVNDLDLLEIKNYETNTKKTVITVQNSLVKHLTRTMDKDIQLHDHQYDIYLDNSPAQNLNIFQTLNINTIHISGDFSSDQKTEILCHRFVIEKGANISLTHPSQIKILNKNGFEIAEGSLKLHKDSKIYIDGARLRQTPQDYEQYKHIFCLSQ